jgi:superfamily I DNA and/or RNA helicase
MRFRPSIDHQPGIVPVLKDKFRELGAPRAVDQIEASKWCAVAATPGGVFSLVKDQWPKDIFGHEIAHCLVLDEASQMNLPEAIMAALPLAADGQLIVVGDHRQMPPIVKNDWNNESRRTFQEFRTYESLFVTLLERDAPIIRFARSFRLHADMAEFLRREIYSLDGIDYHSKRHDVIDHHHLGDSFLAAVLNPNHPLTVIVHEEASSQVLNEYELQLISPILATLADTSIYNLMPDTGFGVVVPHRAQRAAFQERSPDLNMLDDHGEVLVSAVDTVERFQGDERTVMLIGATESDRDYLLVSSKFLLDPRRLTVALSRARQKMILVASRSVFEIFSTDEETFANAQLWKNLLRKTCTVPLWEGERHGAQVQVWGNPSSDGIAQDRSW